MTQTNSQQIRKAETILCIIHDHSEIKHQELQSIHKFMDIKEQTIE